MQLNHIQVLSKIEVTFGKMKGILRAKLAQATTEDADGNPVVLEAKYSSEIPCKYVSANRNDTVDIGGGVFEQARYIITVRDMKFDASQIELKNSRGDVIAENDVKVLEVLENIKRVKIVI